MQLSNVPLFMKHLQNIPSVLQFDSKAAALVENKLCNRYGNIVACKFSFIFLQSSSHNLISCNYLLLHVKYCVYIRTHVFLLWDALVARKRHGSMFGSFVSIFDECCYLSFVTYSSKATICSACKTYNLVLSCVDILFQECSAVA
jgi:hypothetical protein